MLQGWNSLPGAKEKVGHGPEVLGQIRDENRDARLDSYDQIGGRYDRLQS